MHELYDLGYLDLRKSEKLAQFCQAIDAVVVDARFSPNSRDPQWRKGALEKLLGERYHHVKALGNKNYKGGEIDFVDLQGGIDAIAHLLQSHPVIVMCACWKRHICHRVNVVEAFEKEYGVPSTPLTAKMVKEIVGENPQPFKDTDQMAFW
jgi:uncharacterized protein (DUF488 family)